MRLRRRLRRASAVALGRIAEQPQRPGEQGEGAEARCYAAVSNEPLLPHPCDCCDATGHSAQRRVQLPCAEAERASRRTPPAGLRPPPRLKRRAGERQCNS